MLSAVTIDGGVVTRCMLLGDEWTIDPDGTAARGPASYVVVTEDSIEEVPYEAVIYAPEGGRIVASDEAAPGWTWTEGGGFVAPPPAPVPEPTAEEVHLSATLGDADRKDLVDRLRTLTPDQIRSYVQTSVTDLASAKVLLAKVILVLSAIAYR